MFNIVVLGAPAVKLETENEKIKEILDKIVEQENRSRSRSIEGQHGSSELNRVRTTSLMTHQSGDTHIKSGFSLVESQPLRSRNAIRNPNLTNSYLGINGNNDVITNSFVSLRSAQILQTAHLGDTVTLTNADASQLWLESRLSMTNQGQLEGQRSTSTKNWRNSEYFKLFKSRIYSLMFLCDTMGFFAYMIVMQV